MLAGTAGSWVGASLMYWGARWLGRPFVCASDATSGCRRRKIELAERWSARYGWAGVFFSRLLPVIRHLIGIPAGILRLDFRWYSAATLAGSLLWCSVLAWLGSDGRQHPELLQGSLHRFLLLVLAARAVLGALYYLFVASRPRRGLDAAYRRRRGTASSRRRVPLGGRRRRSFRPGIWRRSPQRPH